MLEGVGKIGERGREFGRTAMRISVESEIWWSRGWENSAGSKEILDRDWEGKMKLSRIGFGKDSRIGG